MDSEPLPSCGGFVVSSLQDGDRHAMMAGAATNNADMRKPPHLFLAVAMRGLGATVSYTVARSGVPRPEPTPTGWTAVSNLIRTLGLTPREEQLVNRLLECRRDGRDPWPSVRLLAARMHCSERTVQRTIASLESRGLLVVEYRYRDDGGQQSSVYHLAAVLTPQRDAPRHQGVTRTASKEEHPGKQTQRMDRDYGPPGRRHDPAMFGNWT